MIGAGVLWLSAIAHADPQVLQMGGIPAVEVKHYRFWHPKAALRLERQPMEYLTAAKVIRSFDRNEVKWPVPPLAIEVSVGHPKQTLMLALDTTSGTTWLVEVSAQTYADELKGVLLYRCLGSSTAQYVKTAELRPRVHVLLDSFVSNGELVGRVTTDTVAVAGAVVPRQPLVLAEKVPAAVRAWRVAGSFGLGVRSTSTAPIANTWHKAWIDGPASFYKDPMEEALRDTDDNVIARGGTSSGRLPAPVFSLWPTVGGGSNASMWLGVGYIPGIAWASLSTAASGWAAEGHVGVQNAEGGPRRWLARLLIDSTTPFIGVPMRHFADFTSAILPSAIARLCWWHAPENSWVQVQCDCNAVDHGNEMRFEVAGRTLPVTAADLFSYELAPEACAALFVPLSEPDEIWRLGAPFLKRHAVILDVPRNRLGFADPPPPPLVDVMSRRREFEGKYSLWTSHSAGDIVPASPSDSVAQGFSPFLVAGFALFLVAAAVVALPRNTLGLATRREGGEQVPLPGHGWVPVATSPPCDEEDRGCSSDADLY
eukprot:gnl/TRDRNA2_/TRDRNA2_36253_c0_seq1.p1 gnl/TRDRNA2_/TRDRNA2_36253_c0~~gnl/TRDRNA2_/TRDRNA2_36253_c0_seq1.p1  ORF type:complete len:541 (-),score=62.01 gnl/TRDRNA2_/TRDRNA2_36253_c0_seq1:94-1716(-)